VNRTGARICTLVMLALAPSFFASFAIGQDEEEPPANPLWVAYETIFDAQRGLYNGDPYEDHEFNIADALATTVELLATQTFEPATEAFAEKIVSDVYAIIAEYENRPELYAVARYEIGRAVVLDPESSSYRYNAGYLAFRAEQHEEAFEHFAICAEMDHGGCRVNMASARLSGIGGVTIDIDRALADLEELGGSGTEYHCAAAYALSEIGDVYAYMPGHRDADAARAVYERSGEAARAVAAGSDSEGFACNERSLILDLYLLGATTGDEDPLTLRPLADDVIDVPMVRVARMFLGELEEEALVAPLEDGRTLQPYDFCSMRFYLAQHAQVFGNAAAFNANKSYLEDHPICVDALAYLP